jgi:uncharacterized protein YkwD
MTRISSLLACALVTAVCAISGPAAAGARANPRLDVIERAVIRHVNAVRAYHGLARVRRSRALSRAADRHSRDMLRRNFFAHASSDGTPFDRRVRRFARAGIVGETLAWVSPRGRARLVVRMWLESPPHRAILLSGGFRRIGVARRSGLLGGSARAVVTADFAS